MFDFTKTIEIDKILIWIKSEILVIARKYHDLVALEANHSASWTKVMTFVFSPPSRKGRKKQDNREKSIFDIHVPMWGAKASLEMCKLSGRAEALKDMYCRLLEDAFEEKSSWGWTSEMDAQVLKGTGIPEIRRIFGLSYQNARTVAAWRKRYLKALASKK